MPPIVRSVLLLAALIVAGLAASAWGEAAVPTAPGLGADAVVGIVQAAGGAPIVGVRVELLEGGRLVASTVTTGSGGFRIALPRLRPGGTPGVVGGTGGTGSTGSTGGTGGTGGTQTSAIRAERLGYATVERPLTAEEMAGTLVRLVMEPAPLPVPGLRVEVASESCPDRNHPEGAALWEAMSRLHPDGLDTLGAASYTLARTDTLPAGRVIRGSADGPLTAGQRGFSGRLRAAWERRLDRDGYAFPVRRTDLSGSFDAWSYAPLEADFASHFGTPLFARHQRFRAPSPGPDGGFIVPFCAADSRRAGVEGYLELSADTLLLRVDWRFRTPDPDENAGGWTRFPESARGTPAPLLLPLEAVVWRTIRSGEVQRRSQWYEAWTVTPGDSVPFLPERADTVDPRPSAR